MEHREFVGLLIVTAIEDVASPKPSVLRTIGLTARDAEVRERPNVLHAPSWTVRRLHGAIGAVPPAEFEALYHSQRDTTDAA
jgi:hypothetical protein